MTKICKRCGEIKPLEQFTKSQSNKDGHVTECKPCKVTYVREHYRSGPGRISYIYLGQLQSSKVRGHVPPEYTKTQLYEWAMHHGLDALLDAWKHSGYSKHLAPSVDRVDPNKPYKFDNIRLVTWEANNNKAYADRKSCEHITRQNRKIRQIALDGTLIACFDSISNASRVTGITRVNINDVCRRKPNCKTAGGFSWEYAD